MCDGFMCGGFIWWLPLMTVWYDNFPRRFHLTVSRDGFTRVTIHLTVSCDRFIVDGFTFVGFTFVGFMRRLRCHATVSSDIFTRRFHATVSSHVKRKALACNRQTINRRIKRSQMRGFIWSFYVGRFHVMVSCDGFMRRFHAKLYLMVSGDRFIWRPCTRSCCMKRSYKPS